MNTDELVLCVPTVSLSMYAASFLYEPDAQTESHYFPLTVSELEYLSRHCFFSPRGKCEYDDNSKQVIPYVLVRHGDRYLACSRTSASGERRLVGKGTIGFGGHINPADNRFGTRPNLVDAVQQCALRELGEELGLWELSTSAISLSGLLCSNTDDVSRKHIGVVAVADLNDNITITPEKTLTHLAWLKPDELFYDVDGYEAWSRCLIKLLYEREGIE